MPNYQARNSANEPGVLASFPLPGVLSRTVSYNYCLTIPPRDPSLQTREASLPRNHTSLQVPTGSALPQAGSQGDATHGEI